MVEIKFELQNSTKTMDRSLYLADVQEFIEWSLNDGTSELGAIDIVKKYVNMQLLVDIEYTFNIMSGANDENARKYILRDTEYSTRVFETNFKRLFGLTNAGYDELIAELSKNAKKVESDDLVAEYKQARDNVNNDIIRYGKIVRKQLVGKVTVTQADAFDSLVKSVVFPGLSSCGGYLAYKEYSKKKQSSN